VTLPPHVPPGDSAGEPLPPEPDTERAVVEGGGPERINPLEERSKGAASAADRWAHRRGEPRVFALFWTMFLMSAALLTVLVDRMPRGLDAAHVRTPSRVLMVLVATGLVLLWPMVRLSQASPRRPALAALIDVFVILLPMQAVLWPTTFIAGWGWTVTAWVSATLACWTLLLGGVIGVATRTPWTEPRTLWMIVCAAIALGGPAFWTLSQLAGAPEVRGALLASPLSAVYVLTSPAGNTAPAPPPGMWLAAAIVLGASVPLWVWAACPAPRAVAGPARGGYN